MSENDNSKLVILLFGVILLALFIYAINNTHCKQKVDTVVEKTETKDSYQAAPNRCSCCKDFDPAYDFLCPKNCRTFGVINCNQGKMM